MNDLILIAIWSHNRQQQHIPLFGQTIRIGHDSHNDLVLPDTYTPQAPYHASVYGLDGKLYIHDPQHIGNVYINGKRLTDPQELTPGTPIYVGRPGKPTPYLKLLIEEPQLTQKMTNPVWDAPTMSHVLESITDNPGDTTLPYLHYGWKESETYTYVLPTTPVIVGRSPKANLMIPDKLKFVSGMHFQIWWDGQQYVIQDKTSTNGTLINRRPITPNLAYPLYDGDTISIQVDAPGKLVWFVFHNPLEPKITPPEPQEIVRPTETNTPKNLWERIRSLFSSND